MSVYDYIFLWDEDLGVEHFNPGRYLRIVRYEGLEISQPALDPNSTEIHHRITIRARTKKFHRRVYERRGSTKCSDVSEGHHAPDLWRVWLQYFQDLPGTVHGILYRMI